MEIPTVILIGATAIIFFAAATYLHMLRKKSEKTVPLPFLNPAGKRRPKPKK